MASIAVLIPCYNEAPTVAQVVADFRKALPTASIYVYDNNSSDDTTKRALEAGAIVRFEALPGKGNVVKRMFADIDADVYVLVDGDATYDAQSAPGFIQALLDQKLDMVNGVRVHEHNSAYRAGHQWGNKFLTYIVCSLFGHRFTDMLSGYRVLSKRFVKSLPIISSGFEIETELTIHALELRLPIVEIETLYFPRPEGSVSKLSTYKDGFKILRMIAALIQHEKPLLFFGVFSLLFVLLAVVLVLPIVGTYLHTGLVPRLPTAVLCASLIILAFLSFYSGLILSTVTRGRKEAKLLAYLMTH